MKEDLVALGVMTGNSLDGVDTVITSFSPKGEIVDIERAFMPLPPGLVQQLREFRELLSAHGADLPKAERAFCKAKGNSSALSQMHDEYIAVVGRACNELMQRAVARGVINSCEAIDVIGFHGQTCAHLPPSVAQNSGSPYTVQLGNGQQLADMLGIPVVYDFRSDDLMHGGEGAPLAPMHHQHLAEVTRTKGNFPIGFINAGNTGNISVITTRLGSKAVETFGWDTGPCNHFPDLLAREECGMSHDEDGRIGAQGRVNESLLRILFERSAITSDGSNFLTKLPPRSSDPQWYRASPELLGKAPVDGVILALSDRMRTAEYFAVYCMVHSMTLIDKDCQLPVCLGLCGGGWKNPVLVTHLRELLGRNGQAVILEEHRASHEQLKAQVSSKGITIEAASAFGFDPQAMEARIFADAAVRRIWNEPFTLPQTTGVKQPCVCGLVSFPHNCDRRSFKIAKIMDDAGTLEIALKTSAPRDLRFGRAVPGWSRE